MTKKLAARTICTFLFAAAGCTTIDSHVRVEGWPELKVVEHRVAYDEMRARCRKYVGPLMTPLGCTEFHFGAGEAHIYVTPELPLEGVLAHERLHAAGYDHIGSDHMQRLWREWQARHPAAAARAEAGVAASGLLR
jgi:hypothetical protein